MKLIKSVLEIMYSYYLLRIDLFRDRYCSAVWHIKKCCQCDVSVRYCLYSHGRAGELVTGGQSLASGNNGGICIASTAHDWPAQQVDLYRAAHQTILYKLLLSSNSSFREYLSQLTLQSPNIDWLPKDQTKRFAKERCKMYTKIIDMV